MPGGPNVPRVETTDAFDAWFGRLRNPVARARILVRIDRLQGGNPGDVKPVGDGVLELRFAFGPGYRVYFVRRGAVLVVLLAGGDKGSQASDIRLAAELE